MTPLKLEIKFTPIFFYDHGEFDHLNQVDTLNIIGFSNIHTTTHSQILCSVRKKVYLSLKFAIFMQKAYKIL